MKGINTLVACVVAAATAGIITEWSVTKDAVQAMVQSGQTCVPQINSVPFELHGQGKEYE